VSWWTKLLGIDEAPVDLRSRVVELEESLDRERRGNADARIRIASRAREDQALVLRYREALEFYAKRDNWRIGGLETKPKANNDGGLRARRALGLVE
jgi:hypothetical protein